MLNMIANLFLLTKRLKLILKQMGWFNILVQQIIFNAPRIQLRFGKACRFSPPQFGVAFDLDARSYYYQHKVKFMIYIFEGMDNCLKDTLIQLFRSTLPPQTQILKYNSPPSGISNVELWQKAHLEDMFELLKTSLNNSPRNVILNRAHLGE